MVQFSVIAHHYLCSAASGLRNWCDFAAIFYGCSERGFPPELEGIEIDGRLVVVFSPLDLSCALENQGSVECKGYMRADAAKIGINAILYAMQN